MVVVEVHRLKMSVKWLENQLVAARRAGEHKTPHEYHPRDVPEVHMRRYPTWEAVGGRRLVWKLLEVCTRIGDGGGSCGILPTLGFWSSTTRQIEIYRCLERTPD